VPLVLLAAVGSLLYPGGGMVMAVLALICLFVFREDASVLPFVIGIPWDSPRESGFW